MPTIFVKYGETGTIKDFLENKEDKEIYGEDVKIVCELLEAKPEEIILTTSDEDFKFTKQELYLMAKELKSDSGETLYEYNGLKFCYQYVEGGLEVYQFVKNNLKEYEITSSK